MNKTIFVFSLFSIMLLSIPAVVLGQTGVNVEAETKTEIKINTGKGNETKSNSPETKSNEEMNGNNTNQNSQEKSTVKSESSSKSESKMESPVGDVLITSKENRKILVGLPDKYPMPSVSAKNSVSLQTNQHLYKPGDNVHVQGSLWTELLASLSDTNLITIKVFDNKKSVIYEANSQISAKGNYSTEFTLPQDAPNGSYTITSNIELDENVSKLIELKGSTNIGATTKIAVVSPSVFKINVENHGDYDVKVSTNSTVNSVVFKGDEKRVSVTVQGESGTRGVSHITIPKSLVSGEMKVMIDGKAVENEHLITTVNTETTTEIEVNYSHSVHTIDVIGTNAVPEFGTIAALILITMVSATIVISTKSRMRIIQ
ncbi:MAG: MG2 domain-containing protein [Nitrosarchaeum sp.]